MSRVGTTEQPTTVAPGSPPGGRGCRDRRQGQQQHADAAVAASPVQGPRSGGRGRALHPGRRPGVCAPEGRRPTATSRTGHRVCRRCGRIRPAVAARSETRDWCCREPLHHELPLQASDASHL